MQYIQDEDDTSAAAAAAFDNVGFESAGTAIRAVAEDIEIRTEEDGSYTIITPGTASKPPPGSAAAKAGGKSRTEVKYEKPGDDARQAMVESGGSSGAPSPASTCPTRPCWPRAAGRS